MSYYATTKVKTSALLVYLSCLFIFTGCIKSSMCSRCSEDVVVAKHSHPKKLLSNDSISIKNKQESPSDNLAPSNKVISRLWCFTDIILYVVVPILVALALKNTGKENKLLSRVSALIYKIMLRVINRIIRRK